MKRTVAYLGPLFSIEFARRRDQSEPGRDFFEELEDADQAKLHALFKRLGDHGRIDNREKFKKITDDLWEFKSFQIRLLCEFRLGRVVVISHGFKKKKGAISPSELERARNILREDSMRSGR